MLSAFFKSIFCSEIRKSPLEDLPSPIEGTYYNIPANQGKYLVLDLDETLIHTKTTRFDSFTKAITVTTGGQKVRCYVAKRPYLEEFIEEMSKLYFIVVFTSSPKEYAEYMVKAFGIDKYVQKLLHRRDCTEFWQGVTKDLKKLNVPLKDVILVDDSLINSHYQPDNILLLKAFEGQKNDKVLLDLIPFLKDQYSLDDVRNVDSRYVAYMKMLKVRDLKLKKEAEDQLLIEREAAKNISELQKKSSIDCQSTAYTYSSGEKVVESDSFPDRTLDDLYQNDFNSPALA